MARRRQHPQAGAVARRDLLHRRHTLKEYRKYIEKDRSLLRRFQAIQIRPPTPEETYRSSRASRTATRPSTRCITPEALRAAIYQSGRYITDRYLPDKAIDVIDEAGARVKLRRVRDTQNLRRLEQDIRQVVQEMKAAISDKDFERAVYLREREIELREDLEKMGVVAEETASSRSPGTTSRRSSRPGPASRSRRCSPRKPSG